VSVEHPFWFPLPRRDGGGKRGNGAGKPVDARAVAAEAVDSKVVDCGLYQDGERRGGRIGIEHALAEADACEDGFAWIGVHDPTPEIVETVGRHFELHPLAVEDAVHAHQRAKLEVFGDTLFVVLKTARYLDHEELVEIGEVMVFLGAKFVVTIRHGAGSPLHEVRRDLEAHPDLLAIGPSSVLYAVADRIVDDYATVADMVAIDVEEVEAEVFSSTRHNAAKRIYKLKREVIQFKRAVAPAVVPMQRLANKQAGLPLDPRTAAYFRDVHDHLVRDAERIASFGELLNGVLQANLSQVTVRANNDMRRISAWVAIAAVPTMVFGLYGMNFDTMPELRWRLGYPLVLAVVLLICLLLYRKFRKVGWL
jgi:magnesium transporter